jgi:septal ring factor EnvC (AmiA/AmiB activator)
MADETDVRSKLDAVEQTLGDARSKADALKDQAEKAEREITQFRDALIQAGARTRELEDRVTKIETRLADLDDEVTTKSLALRLRARELGLSLGALARLSRRPSVALIASPYAAIDTARSAMLLGQVVPELESRAAMLRRDLVQLASLRRDLQAERTRFGEAEDSLARERQALRKLLTRKEQSHRSLLAARTAQQKRLQALARKAKNLQSLLAGLEEEARRTSEMERRAEEAAERTAIAKPEPPEAPKAERRNNEPSGQKLAALPPPTAPGPAPRKLPESFAEARGKLPLPARGKLVQMFGTKTDLGSPSKGVTIATRPAATVVAPYDGKVAFAGQFRGYGELLIIAHGGGYHTLLAGMDRNFGVVGQWLLAGEPVGLMSDGRDGKPRLYVELRRNGVPINPLPWLAASERKVSG